MATFPVSSADLLRRLIEAEKKGAPLIRAELSQDLDDVRQGWEAGHIVIKDRNGATLCIAHHDSEFIATISGKAWLAEYELNR